MENKKNQSKTSVIDSNKNYAAEYLVKKIKNNYDYVTSFEQPIRNNSIDKLNFCYADTNQINSQTLDDIIKDKYFLDSQLNSGFDNISSNSLLEEDKLNTQIDWSVLNNKIPQKQNEQEDISKLDLTKQNQNADELLSNNYYTDYYKVNNLDTNNKNLPIFFNHLSKNAIQNIVLDKLGFSNEELVEQLHTLAIKFDWKEIDILKWLLNPQNVVQFQNTSNLINKNQPIDLENNISNQKEKTDEPNILASTTNNLELANNQLKDQTSKKQFNQKQTRFCHLCYQIDNYLKHHNFNNYSNLLNNNNNNVTSKLESSSNLTTNFEYLKLNNKLLKSDFETKTNEINSNIKLNNQLLANDFNLKIKEIYENIKIDNQTLKNEINQKFNEITNSVKFNNQLLANNLNQAQKDFGVQTKSLNDNLLFNNQLLVNDFNQKIKEMDNSIKFNNQLNANNFESSQKNITNIINNKFDLINQQINGIQNNFKATLIEESYRTLLLDKQTETIKNHIDNKLNNATNNLDNKIKEFTNQFKNNQINYLKPNHIEVEHEQLVSKQNDKKDLKPLKNEVLNKNTKADSSNKVINNKLENKFKDFNNNFKDFNNDVKNKLDAIKKQFESQQNLTINNFNSLNKNVNDVKEQLKNINKNQKEVIKTQIKPINEFVTTFNQQDSKIDKKFTYLPKEEEKLKELKEQSKQTSSFKIESKPISVPILNLNPNKEIKLDNDYLSNDNVNKNSLKFTFVESLIDFSDNNITESNEKNQDKYDDKTLYESLEIKEIQNLNLNQNDIENLDSNQNIKTEKLNIVDFKTSETELDLIDLKTANQNDFDIDLHYENETTPIDFYFEDNNNLNVNNNDINVIKTIDEFNLNSYTQNEIEQIKQADDFISKVLTEDEIIPINEINDNLNLKEINNANENEFTTFTLEDFESDLPLPFINPNNLNSVNQFISDDNEFINPLEELVNQLLIDKVFSEFNKENINNSEKEEDVKNNITNTDLNNLNILADKEEISLIDLDTNFIDPYNVFSVNQFNTDNQYFDPLQESSNQEKINELYNQLVNDNKQQEINVDHFEFDFNKNESEEFFVADESNLEFNNCNKNLDSTEKENVLQTVENLKLDETSEFNFNDLESEINYDNPLFIEDLKFPFIDTINQKAVEQFTKGSNYLDPFLDLENQKVIHNLFIEINNNENQKIYQQIQNDKSLDVNEQTFNIDEILDMWSDDIKNDKNSINENQTLSELDNDLEQDFVSNQSSIIDYENQAKTYVGIQPLELGSDLNLDQKNEKNKDVIISDLQTDTNYESIESDKISASKLIENQSQETNNNIYNKVIKEEIGQINNEISNKSTIIADKEFINNSYDKIEVYKKDMLTEIDEMIKVLKEINVNEATIADFEIVKNKLESV